MKILLKSLLLVMLVGFGSVAYAGAEPQEYDFSISDIEELEAEPFQQIEGKWQVEAEIGDKEFTFYVYEIDNEEELVGEIADELDSRFGLDISDTQVKSLLEIDEDEFDEEDEDEDVELEIEAERYKPVNGKWKVEAEFNDKDVTFYVYKIQDKEELISEITDYLNETYKLGLSDSEVEDVLDYDEDGFVAYEEEKVKEKEGKKDVEKVETKKEISSSERDELVRALILLIISIILQGDGDSNLDLGELLKQL